MMAAITQVWDKLKQALRALFYTNPLSKKALQAFWLAKFANLRRTDVNLTRVRDNLKLSLREGLLRKPSLKDEK